MIVIDARVAMGCPALVCSPSPSPSSSPCELLWLHMLVTTMQSPWLTNHNIEVAMVMLSGLLIELMMLIHTITRTRAWCSGLKGTDLLPAGVLTVCVVCSHIVLPICVRGPPVLCCPLPLVCALSTNMETLAALKPLWELVAFRHNLT